MAYPVGAPPSIGADQLAGPPPPPGGMSPGGGGMPDGANSGMSMAGLVGGSAAGSKPTSAMPPEILTGITTAAAQIGDLLDSFAQVTPDKAAQLAMIKDLLQQYLADLLAAGSQPMSPTATGPAFPGGGMDRGMSGAGAV